jgi:hypothetical protein
MYGDTERLRRVVRVLRCGACAAPPHEHMSSANRVSVHPILNWGTWVLASAVDID